MPQVDADTDGVKEDVIESVSGALGTLGKGCMNCFNKLATNALTTYKASGCKGFEKKCEQADKYLVNSANKAAE